MHPKPPMAGDSLQQPRSYLKPRASGQVLYPDGDFNALRRTARERYSLVFEHQGDHSCDAVYFTPIKIATLAPAGTPL